MTGDLAGACNAAWEYESLLGAFQRYDLSTMENATSEAIRDLRTLTERLRMVFTERDDCPVCNAVEASAIHAHAYQAQLAAEALYARIEALYVQIGLALPHESSEASDAEDVPEKDF